MTDSGIPYAICGIATDISERVKATEELESTRSLLMAAIECSPAGIIIADARDGRIRFANNAARLLTEEEETALIGSRISALAKSGQCFHPDGTPFDPDELPLNRALMRGDTCANIEVALQTPEGGERFLLSNAAAVRDADGEVSAGILVFADITDRHHALKQVRESEDRFRKLADATREGVLIHEKGRILEFNDNVPGMFEHDRRELHTTDVYSLFVPEQRDMLRSSVSRQNFAVIATRGLRRDGGQFDIEVSVRQIMYEGRAAEVFAIRDVSELKRMLSELERSEARYRSFIAASSEGIWRADVDPPVPVDLGLPEQVARLSRQLRLAECNLALAHMYGIAGTSEMIGKSADELFGSEDCAEILSEWIRAGYRLVDHESRDRARDGREIWSSSSLTGVIENRQLVRAWGTRHDITGRKLAEHAFERTNRFRTRITETSPHIIYVFDILERKNIFVNHKFTELLGYAPEQIAAMGDDFLSQLLHPEDLAHVSELLNRWNEATDDDVLSTEYRMRDIHGNWRWFLGTDTVFERTPDGRVKRIIGNAQDITEQKNYVEQLEYQANHDLLTGLPNRNWLLNAIDDIIKSGIGRIALMLIDLDRFKEINDALGHELGDELLKQIGPRLRATLPGSSSRIARLGGDEFAIVTHDSGDSPDSALPEAILAAIRRPFSLGEISVDVSASIGVAMYPEHGNSAATLLRCADVAMYKAKSRSAGVIVYDASLDEQTRGRLELLSDMRAALDSGQLQLFYQPKICMPDRRVSGFEALVRWQHPRYGLLTPKRFFHLIEAGHLIHDVTLQILAQALKEWRRWKDEGLVTSIAVNISVRNLLDDRFPAQVGELLREHVVDDGVLELEITESAIIVDPERAFEALKRINEMGVRLTIDDYGTGYSSLAYLKRLPLHSLKVDLSFIQQMIRSEQDAIIVESTISLAHNLGIMVVAEGVEDQPTYTALQRLGCDEAQGFFIARPMSVDEVLPWVRGTAG